MGLRERYVVEMGKGEILVKFGVIWVEGNGLSGGFGEGLGYGVMEG